MQKQLSLLWRIVSSLLFGVAPIRWLYFYLLRRRAASAAVGPARKKVGIVGTGFGGLNMAINLKQTGIPFTIYERNDKVGGTWLVNTYPGCECDVPSRFYQLSYHMKKEWSAGWAPQAEILNYMVEVVKWWKLEENISFNTQVTKATYQPKTQQWKLELVNSRTGQVTEELVDYFIPSTGVLSIPSIPSLPGRKDFKAPEFHSAIWDHSVDLTGKRVALVGTGSSGVQAAPHLANQCKELYVIQRTPSHVMPKGNFQWGPLRKKFIGLPVIRLVHRWMLFFYHELFWALVIHPPKWRIVKALAHYMKGRLMNPAIKLIYQCFSNPGASLSPDEALRVLVPTYPMGCKRAVFHDGYYEAISQDHVKVLPGAAARLEGANTLVVNLNSGKEKALEVDAVVYCTGFKATQLLSSIQIIGEQGQELSKVWGESPYAYQGVTVDGFPNLFLIYGPGTNTGHTSVIFLEECQCLFISELLVGMIEKGAGSLSVTKDVVQKYRTQRSKDLKETIWAADCNSWYRNAEGEAVLNLPRSAISYWWQLITFDWADYSTEPLRTQERS